MGDVRAAMGGVTSWIRQDVQATAVRHRDDGLLDPLVGRDVEDRLEGHDRRLPALEAEALLADVARVQEAFEDLGLVQRLEHAMLVVDAQRGTHALDAALDPLLLLGIHDVAVLDADRPTVGLAQDREDLFERRLAASGETVDDEGALQVPHRESVVGDVEFGVQGRRL